MMRIPFNRRVAVQPHERSGLTVVEFLVVLGVLVLLVALLLPNVGSRKESPRSSCRLNLKQIALALHGYHDQHSAFPPAFTVDADGRQLHSWRTLILPYLGEQQLYESIDLSKPWDDPANARAAGTRIAVYQCQAVKLPTNHTTYLASVGADACLHPTEPRKLLEIVDGAANTLMLIEVDVTRAVPWMSPQDADAEVVLSVGQPRSNHASGMQMALVDGSVRDLPDSAAERRALITIAGGETSEPSR